MGSIIVLGAGEVQVPVIKECKRLGLKTYVTDYDKNAPGFQFADERLIISTLDEKSVLDAVIKYQIGGIITTSDYPVRVVAYVCEKLGLPGLSMAAAEMCTNKFMLRECLKKNGIPAPHFFKTSDKDDLGRSFNLNYPVIVKPVDSSASRGVKKVSDFNELLNAFREAKKFSKSGDVIIEEFIVGKEYSIETLSVKGEVHIIAFTEKVTNGMSDDYFVEDRHTIPAGISDNDRLAVETMLKRVLNVIGIDNCASHTEFILSSKGPYIVEIGARLGGDYITSDLVPLATGINMLENIINISLSQEINIEPTKASFSGVQFINSSNYYKVKDHLKRIESNKGFVRSEVKEYRKVDLKNSLDRLGYYICVCKTKQELDRILDYDDVKQI